MVDTSGKASSLIAFDPPLDKSRGVARSNAKGYRCDIVGGRMRFQISALAFGVVFLIAAGPVLAADVEAGKTAFKKCALCHTTEAGKNKIGPSMFGVVGRQ